MYRYAALFLSLLTLLSACSRQAPAVPSQSVAVPELPPAPVQVPSEAVVERVAIASFASTQVALLTAPKAPVTESGDAAWLKARADLMRMLEQSPHSPAAGLQEALLSYYRRPDVAALPAGVADPPHTMRLGRSLGTKDEPDPNAPILLRFRSIYDGGAAWQIALVQWKSGGNSFVAPIPEGNAMTVRQVSFQGRPVLLLFQYDSSESPLSVTAYEATGDGRLQPFKLSPPAAVGGVTPTAIAAVQGRRVRLRRAAGSGRAYVDHRILQEGGRLYLLVLTGTEPRSTGETILSLYVAEGGKVHRVTLPDSLGRGGPDRFRSMDGRLILRCPRTQAAGLESCNVLRLEGGAIAVLKAGSLAGEPPVAAREAREKALARFQTGAYPEAAQLFRQATELAPFWVDAWNDLSLAYQKSGDWPAALTAATLAVRQESKSGAAQYNLGVSYLGLKEYQSALAPLQAAAEIQPKSTAVWLALGKAREQARLRTTALMAYEKVLALEPGHAEAVDGVKRVRALLPPK